MYQLEYWDLEKNDEYEKVIKKVVEQCFKEENMENSKLYLSIILTTPEHIHEINNEYRDVDRETDVLSFPIFEKDEIDRKIKNHDFEHEDVLGDIIISLERVREQANEYNHSFEREFAYMIVHGFYHLMESEQQLLRDFVEFFKSLNKSFLVHWNMEGLSFGFIPIKARAENFGFYNLDLSKAKGYNLSFNIFLL